MTTAREENARTLAALLGLAEDEAYPLLDASVLITTTDDYIRLARDIGGLLSRTLSKVSFDVEMGTDPAVEVLLGSGTPRTKAPIVGVGVSGYRLEVRHGVSSLSASASHRLVELLAAGYACAAVVHRAVELDSAFQLRCPITVDLVSLYGEGVKRLHERIDLGVAYLAGAGAIGNAAILGLASLDVHGTVHICDGDKVSDGNLNRCWWFSPDDIGRKKCEQLAARAQSKMPALRLIPRNGTLRDAVSADGDKPIETMFVAVDSRRARRGLQNEMPRRVYDASTTGAQEFVLHVNEALSGDACMSCIYYEDVHENAHEAHVADLLGVDRAAVQANFLSPEAAKAIVARYPHLRLEEVEGQASDTLFKQLCARGELSTDDSSAERVLAPFGFISVLAGLFLSVEIAVRTAVGLDAHSYNFWRLSPWASPEPRLRERRAKRDTCTFCGNPVLCRVVRQAWGSGKRSAAAP